MSLSRCLYLCVPILLLGIGRAFARLSQTATNGDSVLGDLSAPAIKEYLTDNSLPDGFPWGAATAFNTNYYTSSPHTGFIPNEMPENHANLRKALLESTASMSQGAVLHPMDSGSL